MTPAAVGDAQDVPATEQPNGDTQKSSACIDMSGTARPETLYPRSATDGMVSDARYSATASTCHEGMGQ